LASDSKSQKALPKVSR